MKKICLISVTEKKGLIELLNNLDIKAFQIVATSGTFKYLKDNNINSIEINDFTGFKEILNGRVKTLHPKIFAGILAKPNNKNHLDDLKKLKFDCIELVICNLYNFNKTVKQETDEEIILENIDIGGVSLIRASAKNYKNVIILSSPNQYVDYIKKHKDNNLNLEYRKNLAKSAFKLTYQYDMKIFNYFNNIDLDTNILSLENQTKLDYGENPHQSASLIKTDYDKYNIIKVLGNKISYNNILDINAALNLVENFDDKIFCAVFKHTIPCGSAIGITVCEAFQKADSCDPVSAYGGIIVTNQRVTSDLANLIIKKFFEIVIAPEFDEDALKILSQKKKLRAVKYKVKNKNYFYEIKSDYTGILIQQKDYFNNKEFEILKNIDKKNIELINNIQLGIIVSRSIKSNAIVLTNNNMTIGIGAGQPNRIDSVKISIKNAKKFNFSLENSVLCSDGFFPFSDSIEFIKNFGIKTIVQPGGSIRDKEVIATCNQNNLKILLTGYRHFKH